MDGDILVRFYTSAAGKQNMWLELEGSNGIRYEVNNMEDVKNFVEDYIRKNTNLFSGK